MIKFLSPLVLVGIAANVLANTGPGPWANGAYFPGQLDGRYSANVYNNTQARFDAGEMDPPSGNRRFTDTFSSNAATTNNVFTTNVSFSNEVTTQITISNAGPILVTNLVRTTNVAVSTNIISTLITNPGTTNLVSFGAANVVSGVLGFAVRNGTPSASAAGSSSTGGAAGGATGTGGSGSGTGSSGTAGTGAGGTVETIGLDSSHNYFVIYVNGDVFAGKTAAGINLNSKRVAGSLWNGVGGLTYQVVTNSTGSGTLTNFSTGTRVEVLSVPSATAGGYFNAKIKDNTSPFIFKGAGAITVSSANQTASAPTGTYPFDVNGIKSSDNSVSAYGSAGRNAP